MRKPVAFLVLVCALATVGGMTSRAADDPEARGGVTFDASADKSSILVKNGARTVTAAAAKDGWQKGPVGALAVPKSGGRVYKGPTMMADGDDPWSATIPDLPNGTYFVWAVHAVERWQGGMKIDEQKVGSSLAEVTVNNNPNAVRPVGGSVGYADGYPVRRDGGARMEGRGPYSVNAQWRAVAAEPIYMTAVPVDGGYMRKGNADRAGGTWYDANVQLTSALTYNVVVIFAVEANPSNPHPTDPMPHEVGLWVQNK